MVDADHRPTVGIGGAALADLAAREVAALQGQEDGIAAASTLHLAVDLFTGGLPSDATLLWDAHLYPVLRLGLGLARRKADRLPAHDPDVLASRIAGGGGRPVLITDGYCLDCGRVAPLAAYLALLRHYRGILVVDDTQGLGVFGATGPGPFGEGGGGTPTAQDVAGNPSLLLVTSLAKAFSTPMAVLSGPARLLDPMRAAATRVHCSPPAIPAARAALRALRLNARCGANLRRRLARSLRLFRAHCRANGVPLVRAFHPVQTVMLPVGTHAARLSRAAASQGLTVAACQSADGPALRIVLTACHQPDQIAAAVATLARLVQASVLSDGGA